MIFLLTILRVIGAVFIALITSIVAAFVVGIMVNVFFPHEPPGIFEEVIMMAVIAVFAVVLLMAIDRARHKIALSWARHYLQSQPRIAFPAFSAAFPQHDTALLKKFRETVARVFGVEEECIGPDLDLAATRSLRHYLFDVRLAIFDAYMPRPHPNFAFEYLSGNSVAHLLAEAKKWSTWEQGQDPS